MLELDPTSKMFWIMGNPCTVKTHFRRACMMTPCSPYARHLLCDIHMKDNILSKFSELGIKGKTSQLIVRDTFGKDVGTNRFLGLIDVSDAVEFDTSVEGLKEKWISMHAQGEKFVDYFLKHKADAIRRTMTADIRSMAGLGWPPTVYDQNANECMNSVLQREKQLTGKKKLSIPEFVRILRTTINRQRTEEDHVLRRKM